jgi:YYY domain-containing protein
MIEQRNSKSKSSFQRWVYILVLVLILASGAYLRLVGLDWDEEQHLHPDERFLTMVEASISPVQSLGEYFNTSESSLNPHNRGHGFFVYGTLPIFIVRYIADGLGNSGYGQVYLVGRALSALVDLAVVWLVFLVARRLYDLRVGLLASAFYAFAVLPLQQSHFFTVDTFTNFFMLLAIYVAVELMVVGREQKTQNGELTRESDEVGSALVEQAAPILSPWLFVLFGLALGMAVASKINAAPIAIVLPGAAALYLLRLPHERRYRELGRIIAYLVLAGAVSILTFRVFQPYAFDGLGLNPLWLENMRSIQAQAGGDVDFPPALQWARRPVWFSFQNILLWGLGLPLGILAWAGFLWMGWRIIKGDWQPHIIVWGWTALYFAWQSLQWNSTMRYQLPIYPPLVIFAAWAVFALLNRGPQTADRGRRSAWAKAAAWTVGGLVLVLTLAWGFAFTRIYTQPHPRVEASRWMLQNFPGPINLPIERDAEIYNQPVRFSEGVSILENQPYKATFVAADSGQLTEIYLPHVLDARSTGTLLMRLSTSLDAEDLIEAHTLAADQLPQTLSDAHDLVWTFENDHQLDPLQSYALSFEVLGKLEEVDLCSPLVLQIQTVDTFIDQDILNPPDCVVRSGQIYTLKFTPESAGNLASLTLAPALARQAEASQPQTLSLKLSEQADGEALATAQVTSTFTAQADRRGQGYHLQLSEAVDIEQGKSYALEFQLQGAGELIFAGAALANETSWDDGLPLRIDGYDPYGGIYQGGLNFEMYWNDNEEKLQRFTSTLAQADYILISSSRQWGTTTRLPERYPLTSTYYRHLLGCPQERSLEWCYTVAEPGTFGGDLGFEMVEVFQSSPSLGGFEINDQFSEEAFTVYDHPKVFVFAKTDAYDPANVENILGAVDLSKVIHITPRKADTFPANLMLPDERLAEQRQGGTWSQYFDPQALQNRSQILGVILWYLSVWLLGLISYPLVRFALPGLSDHGYPLARTTGLLLLAYLVWLAGSARIPFARPTIGAAILLIALLSAFLVYRQRKDFRQDLQTRGKYYLTVESLFLLFFILMLLIRLGNPDLWHPWKGGEKPMDFSYFNAVLKSTSFPPYDPWFAGGYINYYYYGFVIVGVLVKFLGIVPSFAYNLILPTLFSLVAMGAFSIIWNLGSLTNTAEQQIGRWRAIFSSGRFLSALGGALSMAVLGNLGILQMFFQGFQKLVVTTEEMYQAGFIRRLLWGFQGLFKAIGGSPLPLRIDEWYWNPSRVIAAQHGNPITEFPFFTFLYADLHAHMIALPIALLVVAWALSVVLGKAWARDEQRSALQIVLSLFVGGLAVGAMYPINLSDIYTYLPLGAAAIAYAVWRYWQVEPAALNKIFKLLLIVAGVGLLVIISNQLYQPYAYWYSQGYSSVAVWEGSNTPLAEYLTHWGLFLFLIVSWMVYESLDWMAKTPLSALRKLEPYKGLIISLLVMLLFIILVLSIDMPLEKVGETRLPFGLGVRVIGLVLSLAVWAGVLLLRPNQSDAKRFVLFLVGTGLMLSLTVEIIAAVGDIGRMNTVFKFYLHGWTFLSLSAAAAFGWLTPQLGRWTSPWRIVWQVVFFFLFGIAALYPLLGGYAKIDDRFTSEAPHTLDGMTYMAYATHHEEGGELDLAEDYGAIRWMQDNVQGSPVIIEANQVEYHWGTRFTIYTGLPGVVGWNWHQRQQRTIVPHDWIYERVDGVHEFYTTEDETWAYDFLTRFDVSYIIFGQLERAKYAGPGLNKFSAFEGQLWQQVYQDGDTVIYEVIRDHQTINLAPNP